MNDKPDALYFTLEKPDDYSIERINMYKHAMKKRASHYEADRYIVRTYDLPDLYTERWLLGYEGGDISAGGNEIVVKL